MGFISLILIWMLWPIFLIILAMSVILPILGVALNVAAVILFILNLLFFLLLPAPPRHRRGSGWRRRCHSCAGGAGACRCPGVGARGNPGRCGDPTGRAGATAGHAPPACIMQLFVTSLAPRPKS